MDPQLYKAIKKDNYLQTTNLPYLQQSTIELETQLRHSQQTTNQLETQLTPNKNTTLHIAALFGSTKSAKEILKTSPCLALRVNNKGQTPLHIAAVEGHYKIAKALIEHAPAITEELESGISVPKHMVRMRNEDGDTALHEAVRYNHLDVVKLLLKEDSEFFYLPNEAEETPLYIAAELGLDQFVEEILKTCASPSYSGPASRTALHAAAIFDNKEIMEKLLNWKQVLSEEADLSGWTPLHYAARLGNLQIVRKLLDWDTSLAYITADKDDNKTALHIATSRGHIAIMKYIMIRCPDCWEMVNSKGQNIIHIAIENEQSKVIQFILTQRYLDSLVNQKDNNGNTPLHLLAAAPTEGLLARDLLLHPRAKKMAFNKEGMTPLDAYREKALDTGILEMAFKKHGATGQRNLISKDKDEIATKEKFSAESGGGTVEKLKKLADTNLIVATLIATVSFAAVFTLPGGYDGNAGPNQGNAVLSRRAAFKAFIIADTVAMVFSSCAVFIYFLLAGVKRKRTLLWHQSYANGLLFFAEVAMMIAFVAGLYVVLVANSPYLAITVCFIGCFFFLIVRIELKVLYSHYPSGARIVGVD